MLCAHRVFCLSDVQHLNQSVTVVPTVATDHIETVSDKAAGGANSFDIQLAKSSVVYFLRPQIVGKHSFVRELAIIFVVLASCEVDELILVVRCTGISNVFNKRFELTYDDRVTFFELGVLCDCSMPSISLSKSEQVRADLQDELSN